MLKETDNFLNRYHLPKLSQNQISNFIRPKTPTEIEAVIKSHSTTFCTAQGQIHVALFLIPIAA